MLETPPAQYNYTVWTAQLQEAERAWEERRWAGGSRTTGTPVAAIKAAREKWAAFL